MLRSGRAARLRPALASGLLLLLVVFAAPASADWRPFKPPPGETYFGVTDTGSIGAFRSFADSVGKHPAVIETYHPYGNSLHKAIPRWEAVRARPLLHISTVDEDGNEIVAPKGIALGKSDEYLLRLNRSFAVHHLIAYLRPLGEPNRCLNVYAAYDCTGSSRGERYSPHWYRQAFRRMYILLHGGGRRFQVNRRLKRIGLPGIQRSGGKEPRRLLRAPVAIIWSPLPAGSPDTAKNRPSHFFPGARWVDWVGTDFYSRYPFWKDLGRFYQRFAKGFGKPFALTEWGVWGGDSPRFVRRLFRFVHRNEHARMLVYYQDFGQTNAFRIQNYPSSQGALAGLIDTPEFPGLAPHAPKPEPDEGGVGD